jgi:hypothetical protein
VEDLENRTRAGEVLDLGVLGEEGPEDVSRPPVSRRVLLRTLGVVAVAGCGAVATRSFTVTPPHPQAAPAVVTRNRLRNPVRDVPSRLQLFGVGGDVIVRVDVGTSSVTTTRIPPLVEGQVFVVPGRRQLVVHPVARDVGWLVADDAAPTRLPPRLAGVGAVLPGPDLDHMWTQVSRGRTTSMALVYAEDGWPPVVVPVPPFATTGPVSDGVGGLIFEGVGGLFRISPTGEQTMTNAIVLAVGNGNLLTLRPGVRGRWRSILQLRSGLTEELPVAIGPQLPHGVLAPDASRVVLYAVDDRRHMSLAVVDLPRGDHRRVDLDITGVAGDGTIVWSPDSARLFCLDTNGRVCIVDPTTGGVAQTLDLPPLRQLAVRVPG